MKLSRSTGSLGHIFDNGNRTAESPVSKVFEEARMGKITLPFKVVSLRGMFQLSGLLGKSVKSVNPTQLSTKIKDQIDMIDTVLVPSMHGFRVSQDTWTMHPVVSAANKILFYVEAYQKNKVAELQVEIQNAVIEFMKQVSETLLGRNGLLRHEIFETRIANSMRAVFTPDSRLNYDEVGVSGRHWKLISELALSDNEHIFAILSREPLLWYGSIHVLKVRMLPDLSSDSTCLNPFVHWLMNADYDGDQGSIIIPPHTEKTYPELQKACAMQIRKHGAWKEEFLLQNPKTTVDWTDPKQDASVRQNVWYTLSPKDLLEPKNSEFLTRCVSTGAKKVPTDFHEYAKGISVGRFMELETETALQLTRMKREIGLIGALSDKINQLLFALAPQKLEAGFRFKELITQLLLDSKSGEGAFDSKVLFDLFNRRRIYKSIGRDEFEAKLKSMGFPQEAMSWIGDILDTLWELLPINDAIKTYLPQYQVARSDDYSSLLMVENSKAQCIVDVVMNKLRDKLKENQNERVSDSEDALVSVPNPQSDSNEVEDGISGPTLQHRTQAVG